jgi:glycosyltransferase involved in cell wall biosynthesis
VPPPFFSIVVTTYDRAPIVRRCVDSCLAQSFEDFEVVVVDDGSSDGTVSELEQIGDRRLRLVVHESNRGINPARHTGVVTARGQWIVMVDSDWELFPYTLERLHEIVAGLPDGVRVVRSRLIWDDGRVTPAQVPSGPIDYERRIRWIEADPWTDAGLCVHRDAYEKNPYFEDRRGELEALWELNLARDETSICVDDILGREHMDAPNSYSRPPPASVLRPRLMREAPDLLWMAETALREHGAALARFGPRQHREMLRGASLQAFVLGDRSKGKTYAIESLRARKLDPMVWATLGLGLLGRRAVVRGTIANRRLAGLIRSSA